MNKIYRVTDIFTPTTPAKLTFVERDSINNRIVRALRTPGTQVIIYGHSGCGKTTLLENKLFQVYEKHIRTSCMKGMSFESVVLDAFDQLSVFYLSEKSIGGEKSIDASIKANFRLISTELKSTSKNTSDERLTRALPPQLTAQNLARFMGEAGYCWVLDDFHKIRDADKDRLSQLLKVFMDMSNEYKNLKIICVGAVNTARQVVQYDNEMKERVSEIKVPLMSFNEIEEIIRRGFKLLNVQIDNNILCKDIFHYSSGLAAICHKLCLLMCEALDVEETIHLKNSLSGCKASGEKVSFEHLSYAINEYLDDASDTIKRAFDNAFRIKYASLVLEALAECADEGESIGGIEEIIDSMGEYLGADAIEDIVEGLQTEYGGNTIVFDSETHMFRYSTPFLKTFARSLFEHSSYKQKMTPGELIQLLNKAFSTMKQEYTNDQDDISDQRYTRDI